MVRQIGIHRSNDAHIIDLLANVRKNLADLNAAFTILPEGKRRSHRHARDAFGDQVGRVERLFMPPREFWLGIKGIDVRGSAVEENVDHSFGPRGKVGWLGRERISINGGFRRPCKQRSQSQHSYAHTGSFQEFSSTVNGGSKHVLDRHLFNHHKGIGL